MNELLKKMNYKKGVISVRNAPAEFKPTLEAWSAEYTVDAAASAPQSGDSTQNSAAPFDFFLVFCADAASATRLVAEYSPKVGAATVFWVAFPKQTSPRYKSDINRDKLWPILATFGFRPNRNVAIDDDWSTLRFAKE